MMFIDMYVFRFEPLDELDGSTHYLGKGCSSGSTYPPERAFQTVNYIHKSLASKWIGLDRIIGLDWFQITHITHTHAHAI